MDDLNNKIKTLNCFLKEHNPTLIAYSGGIDSTLLLYFASQLNPTVALTINSPFFSPADKLNLAPSLQQLKKLGSTFKHLIIDYNPLTDPAVAMNSKERCYHCKKLMIKLWKEIAEKNKIKYIFDGSHSEDQKMYRPGQKALVEEGILSPLSLAKFNKDDIYNLSTKLNLYKANRPSQSCLATRVPYNEKLSLNLLGKIAATEKILSALGYEGIRARVHQNNLLRLEIPENKLLTFNQNNNHTFAEIYKALKDIKWSFITIDTLAYRSGCFD